MKKCFMPIFLRLPNYKRATKLAIENFQRWPNNFNNFSKREKHKLRFIQPLRYETFIYQI